MARGANAVFPFAFAPLLLWPASCAHMEAPPGGPVDTKRPYVMAVLPAPDSTGVGRELHAQIAFSEWVAPDAERGKVYLNPPLTKRLKTKLSGNLLEVTSKGTLDTNTTYVLGVLGSIKDLNGQPLESPLQLAFSTGRILDSGKLTGQVAAFQGKPGAGAFAALYPRGPDLRARFQHLTHRNDSAVVPSPQPDPFKERPAYIAPSDSLGRFEFKRLRPGRYGLIGFQDINGDLIPNVGSEALAIGPSIDIAAAPGDAQALALYAYDTIPVRLAEARWSCEAVKGNLAYGTVRLKFNRAPHPIQCLRPQSYTVRKAGPKSAPDSGALVPIQGVCLNPGNGEIELQTAPLDADSQYTAACPGLRDIYGNLADTSRNRMAFKAGRAVDTAKPEMIFLSPRRVSGETPKLPVEGLQPGRGMSVYYPRLLSDSTLGWLRNNLVLKLDTLPAVWTLARLSPHEFALNVSVGVAAGAGPSALKGQRLSIGLKPDSAALAKSAIMDTALAKSGAQAQAIPPSKAPPAPASPAPAAPVAPVSPMAKDTARARPSLPQPIPIASFTLADAAKLGSLKFAQLPSAYGSRLVLRSMSSPFEFSRVTPSAAEFTVDSLPEGYYAVDYFRDLNGDGIWNPGSLAPWAVQEPYVQWTDSVLVKAAGVNRGDGNRPAKASSVSHGSPNPAGPGTPSGASATLPAGTPGATVPSGTPAIPPPSTLERKLCWPPTL